MAEGHPARTWMICWMISPDCSLLLGCRLRDMEGSNKGHMPVVMVGEGRLDRRWEGGTKMTRKLVFFCFFTLAGGFRGFFLKVFFLCSLFMAFNVVFMIKCAASVVGSGGFFF